MGCCCCFVSSSSYQLRLITSLLFFSQLLLSYSLLLVCSAIADHDLPNLELPNEELRRPVICNLQSLVYLDLSDNQFSGPIPDCLGNFSGSLSVLNLQRNHFNGTIPSTFGYASTLRTLDMNHNKLQGVLPKSMANCTKLEILNVGHNSIADVFPFWLENLPKLKVLVLRDNRFHGPIGQPRKSSSSAFTNLHIIDVSHNAFTGPLPSKYFESWHSMMMVDEDASQSRYMGDDGSYYFDSMTVTIKGRDMELVRILTIFKALDFSYNSFHGEIPPSIGKLKALIVLNFSGNGLTGPIPLSMENLTELESLDISQNKLSGQIPHQLSTSLTFLEVVDFSQNNLTGHIPRGRQFETFSNTSYEGNPGLCGFPLSKECGNYGKAAAAAAESPISQLSHRWFKFNADLQFGWEAVVIGYGCGVVIGLVIGSCIIQRREKWLLKIFRLEMYAHGKRSKKAR